MCLCAVQHINWRSSSGRQACTCCSVCLCNLQVQLSVFDYFVYKNSTSSTLCRCANKNVGSLLCLCVHRSVGGEECVHVYLLQTPSTSCSLHSDKLDKGILILLWDEAGTAEMFFSILIPSVTVAQMRGKVPKQGPPDFFCFNLHHKGLKDSPEPPVLTMIMR